jgi:hypothetical protein
MIDSVLSRKTRTFLLWTARLALVAFFMQIAAVGHWQGGLEGVTGIEGSSVHVDHCHGAGDCASGDGVGTAISATPPLLPAPETAIFNVDIPDARAPQSAFVELATEPPQAA